MMMTTVTVRVPSILYLIYLANNIISKISKAKLHWYFCVLPLRCLGGENFHVYDIILLYQGVRLNTWGEGGIRSRSMTWSGLIAIGIIIFVSTVP